VQKDGKELPSREGNLFIRLDSKARLVLPLEIREKLAVGRKEKLLISCADDGGEKITIRLAKAQERAISRAYSKNGSEITKMEG
jgi:bifunctional DNA-binding transcriptional regulator/antitoxin component of YhaV-PrlF toxin-antitoxin module